MTPHEERQELIRDLFLCVLVLILVVGVILAAFTGHVFAGVLCALGLWWVLESASDLARR